MKGTDLVIWVVVSPGGPLSEDISSEIRETDWHLRHLWGHDIRLSIKDRVCAAALRSVLLYGSETWSFREAMRRLLVFEYRCMCSVSRIYWGRFFSNSEVRHKVLGPKI